MAYPNIQLIEALRSTAKRLSEGSYYAWGHHGACNCGSLLQVITSMTKEEILRYAHTGTGEWTEIAEEYCLITGAPVYLMLSKLEALGLTTTDIHNLEYLEDRKVLNNLQGGFRRLKRNVREDVIDYFVAFANMLESELIRNIRIDYKELIGNKGLTVEVV